MASFSKFMEFPPEIQCLIWKHAFEQPAIHFFTAVYPVGSDSVTLKLDSRSAYYRRARLATLCCTSRDAAKIYRRSIRSWTFPVGPEANIELLIDSRNDVICIGAEQPYMETLFNISNDYWPHGDMLTVRRLALECREGVLQAPAGCQQRVDAARPGGSRVVVGPVLVFVKILARFPELEDAYILSEGFPRPQQPVDEGDLIRFRGTGASTDLQLDVYLGSKKEYYEVTTPAGEPTSNFAWWQAWKISEFKRMLQSSQRSHSTQMTILTAMARAANSGNLPGHEMDDMDEDMNIMDEQEYAPATNPADQDDDDGLEDILQANRVGFKLLSG